MTVDEQSCAAVLTIRKAIVERFRCSPTIAFSLFLSLRFHDLMAFIFVFTCLFLHVCFYMPVFTSLFFQACFFMPVFTSLFDALFHHNLATAAIGKAHDVDATLGGLLNLHAVDGVDGDRSVG